MTDISIIDDLLKPEGLTILGVFEGNKSVLVGNSGSEFWPMFCRSEEYKDGLSNPMDRWSRRVGDYVSAQLGALIKYPFEGPPFPPFLDWARRSGSAFRSPISLYVHSDFGLWHAYRFVLIFDRAIAGTSTGIDVMSPCETCVEQPCLTSCPVEAFDVSGYKVDSCVAYLNSESNSACMTSGCAARHACPIKPEFRYEPDHAAFHMQAFLQSRS